MGRYADTPSIALSRDSKWYMIQRYRDPDDEFATMQTLDCDGYWRDGEDEGHVTRKFSVYEYAVLYFEGLKHGAHMDRMDRENLGGGY